MQYYLKILYTGNMHNTYNGVNLFFLEFFKWLNRL